MLAVLPALTIYITFIDFKVTASYSKFNHTLGYDLNLAIHKSSRPEAFCKKGVYRNFAKFTGKHLCQSLFFKSMPEMLYFCET